MSKGLNKAERLIEMERLYFQQAYSDIDMAEKLGVSRQTVFRDRQLLSTQTNLQEVEAGKYKIDRTAYISNIRVDLNEALALYLAARRASQQTRLAFSKTASALEKLALALKQPMTAKLAAAAEDILAQQAQPEREQVLSRIAEAWVTGRKIRITHQGLHVDKAREFLVAPYLIEPSPWSDGTYLIGESDIHQGVAIFKIERIQKVSLPGETFTIPADFDEAELLKHAWGIWSREGDPVIVKLRFTPGTAARRLKESIWHPLEEVTELNDGSYLWQAPIAEPREMLPWIRGWGADVEVLEPEKLRKALERETRRLVKVYGVMEIKPELIAHLRKEDGELQLLWDHLRGVSKLAGQFADKIGLRECGQVLGLLHDLGKASQEFQNYIGSAEGLIDLDADEWVDAKAKKGKIDHSSAGAQVLYQRLSDKSAEGQITAQALALCLASHHSGLIDCLKPDGVNNFERRIEKPEEQTHTTEALTNLEIVDKELSKLFLLNIEEQFIKKLNSLKVPPESHDTLSFKRGLLIRYLFSCLIDADRLDTADFEFPPNLKIRSYGQYHQWETLLQRLNNKIAEFEGKENKSQVDEIRNQISQACFEFASKPKGIYQLTVPTGGGKTFASLRFALNHAAHHKMDRVFYIIPYTSIIDQNADEVRKILEDNNEGGNYLDKVVLEHHSNLTPEEETYRQKLLSENWDAPIVFTTQVQFLEALFGASTRSARRMHQLANAVIIFDEIQTIPIRCVHMFNTALKFLVHTCGATTILCTATQPLLGKVEPETHALVIDGNIISNEKEIYEKLKRVGVFDEQKIGGWDEVEVTELVKQELQEKGSVLVVVNTKKSAQSLYRAISEMDVANIYHLSTNMCPAHRLAVLDDVKVKLEQGKPVICVSTQLIEAGVDVDFGSVIRYLAGLDSITQAAGRCNRNGKQEGLGNVWIVNPGKEKIDMLVDIKVGTGISERILGEFNDNPQMFDNDRIGLAAMKSYYGYYFYQRKKEMGYKVYKNSFVGREDNLFNLLSQNKISVQEYQRIKGAAPTIPFKQSFQTASRAFHAIDPPTQGVIVPYGEIGEEIIVELCAVSEIEKQYKLLKKAQRYSVNLFPRIFKELASIGAIQEVQEGSGIFYLDQQYYSDEFGLSDSAVNTAKTLIC